MAFIGGGFSSIIAQILSVPIDIISQHMMLSGQKKGFNFAFHFKNKQFRFYY
jgi:hypothetical protein